jgi:hypothetical protein
MPSLTRSGTAVFTRLWSERTKPKSVVAVWLSTQILESPSTAVSIAAPYLDSSSRSATGGLGQNQHA